MLDYLKLWYLGKKGKNSIYGRIHKGFDKIYIWLGWN